MTSSLVGSEMCIRDSGNCASRQHRHQVCCRPFGLKAHSLIVRANCQEAVSYTHLTLPTICSV
eukprot:8396696-Prorocentrum_lima.AAC.1